MPDTGHNALSNSSSASPEKLEESVMNLKIDDGDGREGDNGRPTLGSDRRGEPDCNTYLRTGSCTYGSRCKYNHPPITGQGAQHRDQLPQRDGQPDCQFFLRTGICKYGSNCKYNHPRDKHNTQLLQFNALGLPLRKDEKSCSFYMRTGSCKFGVACKFNHPQPDNFGTMFPVEGLSVYGYSGYSGYSVPPTTPYTVGLPWPFSRPPPMSSPAMPGFQAYMPIVLPPTQSTMPMQQDWCTYMGSMGIPSDGSVGSNQILNSKHYAPAVPSVADILPERPDQPECQYYMKTGSCKFGSSCKYHHPKEKNQVSPIMIPSFRPPLNPGEPACTFYARNGSCKHGAACKFDHPFVAVNPIQEPPSYQMGYNFTWTTRGDSFGRIPKAPGETVKSVRITELPDDNEEHEDSKTQISPSYTAPQSDSSYTAPQSDSSALQSD